MTSALLLVAVLVVVDLSYRRWIRRSIAQRMQATIDLEHADAEVIALAPRDARMPRRSVRRDV